MASQTRTGITSTESRVNSLNIPILKFSYSTTSAYRASPLGWTHLSSSGDLTVVFDHILPHETSASFPEGYQCMRVYKGSDILVKFSSDSDYSNAISILAKLGCPITHSASVPPQHASSNRPFSPSSQKPSLLKLNNSGHTMSQALSSRPAVAVDQHQTRPRSPSLTEPSTSGSLISSLSNGSTNVGSYREAHDRPHTSSLSIPHRGTTLNNTTSASPYLDIHRPSSAFRPVERDMPPFPSSHPGPRKMTHCSSKDRPATAPALPDVNSLSQILPPKRELPFAKPGKKAGSKRPSQSRVAAGRQATNPVLSGSGLPLCISQSRTSTSNNPRANLLSVTSQDGSGAVSDGEVSGSYANPNPNPPFWPLTHVVQSAHIGNMAQESTNTAAIESNTLFANSTSAGHVNDLNNKASGTETISTTAISANPRIPAQSTVARGFISLASPKNQNEISQSDLSAYLSTPNAERSALVESWVCSQLESDAFLALCQDVEGVWRRIAFGY
ncbi:conserved hypothetical protein [Histoplasma capsulatum var. duboisii H88]|uniref:Uncharacterized protein n=2 Tax=Ajellomyces capsulatus TaxID=5037 RepID=F0UTM2_AJEC8|nr:conserved hypothetical protein [Histoplasma capsulatum H143]EGC49249.1 conserved hypothetical protein [Histoplasma capsulatum var. duboisii H88]